MNSRTLLTALAVLVAANADAEDVRVRRDGETKVSIALGMRQVAVAVSTKEWLATDVMGERDALAFGATVSAVRAVTIAIDGKPIWAPRSSYADLVDVARVRIEMDKGGMVLVIHGGDASTAYEARLVFDGTGVKGRRLFSGGLMTQEITYKRHVIP